jgi:hypothetical protein
MANSLFPSFVRLFYHTLYAEHVQTLPTRQWSQGLLTYGLFLDWNGIGRAADDMIEDLANKAKVVVPSTTVFDYFEVWNYPDEDSLPQPVATKVLSIAGTSSATGWSEAVQQTFTLRTTDFGIFKFILLDAVTDNFFGKVALADFTTDYNNLMSELMSMDNGWSGRDNARPAIVKGATITLNEKLRREYRLT